MEVEANVPVEEAGPSLTLMELLAHLGGEDTESISAILKTFRGVIIEEGKKAHSKEGQEEEDGPSEQKPLLMQYLEASPEAAEIMRLWHGLSATSASRLATSIVDVMGVMISFAPYEQAFNLARLVLRTRHKALVAALQSQNPRLARCALKLLANAAELSGGLSRDALRIVNISDKAIEKLLSTRHDTIELKGKGAKGNHQKSSAAVAFQDVGKHVHLHGHPDDDIRSCMVKLVCTLLRSPSVEVVRETLRAKGLVVHIVKGLHLDAPAVAEAAVTAFGDACLFNEAVPLRTVREVFNIPLLLELVGLYDTSIDRSVRYAVHGFLVALCTGKLLLNNVEKLEALHERLVTVNGFTGVLSQPNGPDEELHHELFLPDADYERLAQELKVPVQVPSIFSHSIKRRVSLVDPDEMDPFLACGVGEEDNFANVGHGISLVSTRVPEDPVLGFIAQIKLLEAPLVRDLVVRLLNSHPDSAASFVRHFPHSLEPRASLRWACNVRLLSLALCCVKFVWPPLAKPHARIVLRKASSGWTLPPEEEIDAESVGGVAPQVVVSLLIPTGCSRAVLTRAVLHSDAGVVRMALHLLSLFLHRYAIFLTEICDVCVVFPTGGESEAPAATRKFKREAVAHRIAALSRCLLTNLPDIQTVLTLRHRLGLGKGDSSVAHERAEPAAPMDVASQVLLLEVLKQYAKYIPGVVTNSDDPSHATGFDFLKLLSPKTEYNAGMVMDYPFPAMPAEVSRSMMRLFDALPVPTTVAVLDRWLGKPASSISVPRTRELSSIFGLEGGLLSLCRQSPLAALLDYCGSPDDSTKRMACHIVRRILLLCPDHSAPITEHRHLRLFSCRAMDLEESSELPITEPDVWLQSIASLPSSTLLRATIKTDSPTLEGQMAPHCSALLFGLVWCGACDATPSPYSSKGDEAAFNAEFHKKACYFAPFTIRSWRAYCAAVVEFLEEQDVDKETLSRAQTMLAAMGVGPGSDDESVTSNTTRSIAAQHQLVHLNTVLTSLASLAFLVGATLGVCIRLSAASKAILLGELRFYVDHLTAVFAAIQEKAAGPLREWATDSVTMISALSPSEASRFKRGSGVILQEGSLSGKKRPRINEIELTRSIVRGVVQLPAADANNQLLALAIIGHEKQDKALWQRASNLLQLKAGPESRHAGFFDMPIVAMCCNLPVALIRLQEQAICILRLMENVDGEIDDRIAIKELKALSTQPSSHPPPKGLRNVIARLIDSLPVGYLLRESLKAHVSAGSPYQHKKCRKIVHGACYRKWCSGQASADTVSIFLKHAQDDLYDIAEAIEVVLRASPDLTTETQPSALEFVKNLCLLVAGSKVVVSSSECLALEAGTDKSPSLSRHLRIAVSDYVLRHRWLNDVFTGALNGAFPSQILTSLGQICKLVMSDDQVTSIPQDWISAALGFLILPDGAVAALTFLVTLFPELDEKTRQQTLGAVEMIIPLLDVDQLTSITSILGGIQLPSTGSTRCLLTCFTCFLRHGILPSSQLADICVSELKRASVSDADLVRPVEAVLDEMFVATDHLVPELAAVLIQFTPSIERRDKVIASAMQSNSKVIHWLTQAPSKCLKCAAALGHQPLKSKYHAVRDALGWFPAAVRCILSARSSPSIADLAPLAVFILLYVTSEKSAPSCSNDDYTSSLTQSAISLLKSASFLEFPLAVNAILALSKHSESLDSLASWSLGRGPSAMIQLAVLKWQPKAEAEKAPLLSTVLIAACSQLPAAHSSDCDAPVPSTYFTECGAACLCDGAIQAAEILMSVSSRTLWSEIDAKPLLKVAHTFIEKVVGTPLASVPGLLKLSELMLRVCKRGADHRGKSISLDLASLFRRFVGSKSFLRMLLMDQYQFPGSIGDIKLRMNEIPSAKLSAGRLLHFLAVLSPKDCVHESLLPVIASAYTASLSETDLVLRQLLEIYEQHGLLCSTINYAWSAAALRYIPWTDQLLALRGEQGSEDGSIDRAHRNSLNGFEWLFGSEIEATRQHTLKSGVRRAIFRNPQSIGGWSPPEIAKEFVFGLSRSQTGLIPKRVANTVSNFPVYRCSLPGAVESPHEVEFNDYAYESERKPAGPAGEISALLISRRNRVREQIYDPSWLLPCLKAAMAAGRINPRRFAISGALTVAIAALGAAFDSVRQMAYAIVGAYYELLQTPQAKASFQEEPQVSLLLNSIKNAVTEQFQRLPAFHLSLIISFLHVLLRPTHRLYSFVNKYVIRHQQIDLSDCGLVHACLRSPDVDSAAHQMWIIRVLLRSLQCGNDHAVLRRRHVYHLIMSIVGSPALPPAVVRGLLLVLVKASGLRILASRQSLSIGDEMPVEHIDTLADIMTPTEKETIKLNAYDQCNSLVTPHSKDISTFEISKLEADGPKLDHYFSEASIAAVRALEGDGSAAMLDKSRYKVGLGVASYLRKTCLAVPWISCLWSTLTAEAVAKCMAESEASSLSEMVVDRGCTLSRVPLDALLGTVELLVNLCKSAEFAARVSSLRTELHRLLDAGFGARMKLEHVRSALLCEIHEQEVAFQTVLEKCALFAAVAPSSDIAGLGSVQNVVERRAVLPAKACLHHLQELAGVLLPLIEPL